jgi:hypothetical protein
MIEAQDLFDSLKKKDPGIHVEDGTPTLQGIANPK